MEVTDLIRVDDWVVWCSVVRLREELSEPGYLALFERLSGQLLTAGAIVFWLGGEDSSWNPGILNPSNSFGNVFGVAVEGSGLMVSCSEGQFDYLADDVLRAVWERVTSLGVPRDFGAE